MSCMVVLSAARGRQMLGEALMALAQFAGQTVAAAAVTDVWEAARHKSRAAAGTR